MILNSYDVTDVLEHYSHRIDNGQELRNYATAAVILAELVDWTDTHSDGWCYWQKPGRASAKLQDALAGWRDRYIKGDDTDLTADELAKLVTPIKAFLTRQAKDSRYDDTRDSAVALREGITQLVKGSRA